MTASFVATTTLIFFSKYTNSYQIYFGCYAVLASCNSLRRFALNLELLMFWSINVKIRCILVCVISTKTTSITQASFRWCKPAWNFNISLLKQSLPSLLVCLHFNSFLQSVNAPNQFYHHVISELVLAGLQKKNEGCVATTMACFSSSINCGLDQWGWVLTLQFSQSVWELERDAPSAGGPAELRVGKEEMWNENRSPEREG